MPSGRNSRDTSSDELSNSVHATTTVGAYLAAIYEMAAEGVSTIGARVADWLGVTQPTVNGTVRRMVRDGLVTVNGRKEIVLTEEGERLAAAIVRRHRLAERFLVDALQLDWHLAHREAARWERVISAEVEAKLAEFLSRPTTCPHGNPIPGSGYVVPEDVVCLSDVVPGGHYVVDRVFEEIELNAELMEYLDRSGIKPGGRLIVVDVAPFMDTMTVLSGEEKVPLGLRVASKIWVRPVAAPAVEEKPAWS